MTLNYFARGELKLVGNRLEIRSVVTNRDDVQRAGFVAIGRRSGELRSRKHRQLLGQSARLGYAGIEVDCKG
jgi:hypothetical protein